MVWTDCVNENGFRIPLFNRPTIPGLVAPGAIGARGSMPPDTAPVTPDAVAAAAEAKVPR